MLWEIILGEHTANTKSLAIMRHPFWMRGQRRTDTAEAQRIGTQSNCLFTTSFDTTRQAVFIRILRTKKCSNKEWSSKMLLCTCLSERQTLQIIKQTPHNTGTHKHLCDAPTCATVTHACASLTTLSVLAGPVHYV